MYPRASKVALRPPEGKEDASGSPLISSFPLNSIITLPSGEGVINESCFSAVIPVKGWNQCVKCVAPFSTAQFFIASATAFAQLTSRAAPSSIVFLRELYTLWERQAFIILSSKTNDPKMSVTSFIPLPPIKKRQ